MGSDEMLVAGTIATWKAVLSRADKLFTALDVAALEEQVAPGRNRLIYLWGHLSATHDRMIELLGVGERVHPEFDAIFLSAPDRSMGLPSIEVIRTWWAKVSTRLNDGITKFSVSDWLARHTAVSEEDFAKEPLRNRLSILLTRTNHLSYHIGQTSLARK